MFNNNKILVVIPARGGSKGIPRKNIRLLNRRPLISYAINIAKSLLLVIVLMTLWLASLPAGVLRYLLRPTREHRHPTATRQTQKAQSAGLRALYLPPFGVATRPTRDRLLLPSLRMTIIIFPLQR